MRRAMFLFGIFVLIGIININIQKETETETESGSCQELLPPVPLVIEEEMGKIKYYSI
jgi:hypothetical protein